MSNTANPEINNAPKVKTPNSLHMIATLAGVAFLSGFAIVFVVKATEARIDANRRAALEKAVFEVLPGAVSRKTFEVTADGFVENDTPATGIPVVYTGYDDAGELVGVAFEGQANGYAGPVRSLFGYSPEREAIIGFYVLESAETPGLGSRIMTDSAFLANFEALDMSLTSDGTSLANIPVLVKSGNKTKPWEVDGISGATISSRAVANALARRSEDIVPFVHKHLADLTGGR